jgi:hypothetical protein
LFQTLTLEYQSWFQILPFKCNLHRYTKAEAKRKKQAATAEKRAKAATKAGKKIAIALPATGDDGQPRGRGGAVFS